MKKQIQKITISWLIILCIFMINVNMALGQSLVDEFTAIRYDPEPETLTRDTTYYISNENETYLYYDVIKSLKPGGIHIGVGTEPNYIFAGWYHPKYLILFDFDGNIPDIHKVYGIFFKKATTLEEFLGLWKKTKENKKIVYALINEAVVDKKERRNLKRVWRDGARRIAARLKYTKKLYGKANVPTAFTDNAQYQYVASLWKQGRVYAVRGDLTGEKTLQDIAKLAKKHNEVIRTAYFSNAEYYFKFRSGSFKENINALPFDENSLILNTIARTRTDYHYIYTPGLIYRAWVNNTYKTRIINLYRLQWYISKPVPGKEHLYKVDRMPTEKDKKLPYKKKPKSTDSTPKKS